MKGFDMLSAFEKCKISIVLIRQARKFILKIVKNLVGGVL